MSESPDRISVGFTGTSARLTDVQKDKLRGVLAGLAPRMREFHHGDCIEADSFAHDVVHDLGLKDRIVVHPPSNPKKRARRLGAEIRDPKPYMERNQDIVDESDHLVAAPNGEERVRSGTWSTIRRAIKKGIPVTIVKPSGKLIYRHRFEVQP